MFMCVHKIMNMYIHGMYMLQTCMYSFAHPCGGVRIPDGTYAVRTMYIQVQKMYNSTDQYIPVRTEYVPE